MELQLSPVTKSSLFSALRFPECTSCGRRFKVSAFNPSRRLALLHFTTALSQSQLFDKTVLTPLNAEDLIAESYPTSIIDKQNEYAVVEDCLEWTRMDNRRMLHVVFRVGNLDSTIKFYTECLGMKLLRKRDIPEENYSNAFVGYGSEDSHFAMELTYNYGVDKYNIGSGFGHFGIAVSDVAKTLDLIKVKGPKVSQEPSVLRNGNSVTAFTEDPDGYRLELLEGGHISEPLCQVMLRVGDLDRSIDFYRKAFGMDLLSKRKYPEDKYAVAKMGYGPEDTNCILALASHDGVTEYDKGNGYGQIAIGTDDVYKTAQAVKLCGGEVILEPGPLPGINTKITICLDPDGWKTVFVDNIDFMKELA